MQEFLGVLFEVGDMVCAADNPYGTEATNLDGVKPSDSYITLNSLVPGSTRADKNVHTFRNLLVEFDDLGLEEQLAYVSDVGMPFTTCVFSGNKSYHFVLSLVEPLEDKKEYDRLVRWLYAAVPEADPSCKNPSRFTRLGCGTHKNGANQKTEKTQSRISKMELVEWLSSRCEEPRDTTKCIKQMGDVDYLRVQASGYRATMHKATAEFCKTGGRKGFRHKNVFIAACNLRDCYYTVDEAKFLLLTKLGSVYKMQGREEDMDLKERAIEDAYLQPPRTQTRS